MPVGVRPSATDRGVNSWCCAPKKAKTRRCDVHISIHCSPTMHSCSIASSMACSYNCAPSAVAKVQALRCMASDQVDAMADADWQPTVAERLFAVLMYVLPVTHAAYHLILVALEFLQRRVLDLLVLLQVHTRQQRLGQGVFDGVYIDPPALQSMLDEGHALYSELSQQLLGTQSFCAPIGGFLGRVFVTPELLWHVLCMSIMFMQSYIAARLLRQQQACRHDTQHAHAASDTQQRTFGTGIATQKFWSRRPELVVVTSACALMLRLAAAPLHSASGVAVWVYNTVALFLTGFTVVMGLTHMHWLLWTPSSQLLTMLQSLVGQTSTLTVFHFCLICLDWLMCLFTAVPWSVKAQTGLCIVLIVHFQALLEKQAVAALDTH